MNKLVRDSRNPVKYIAYFSDRILVFFKQELRSLADLFGMAGGQGHPAGVKYINADSHGFSQVLYVNRLKATLSEDNELAALIEMMGLYGLKQAKARWQC